jgi:hypothetical protein
VRDQAYRHGSASVRKHASSRGDRDNAATGNARAYGDQNRTAAGNSSSGANAHANEASRAAAPAPSAGRNG